MIYGFDDFLLDTDALELRRGTEAVPLQPQTYSVLVVLLENPDRVVTKEELLDRVWGSRFVSESALTTRIKQARQAVGDDGQAQRLIKTFHGRGYRFVGQVQVRAGSRSRSPAAPRATQLLERDGQIETLIDAVARTTETGRGSLVLVAGEAGLGKTSLVREFCRLSTDERVLVGGCDDLVSPRAFGPLRDLSRLLGGALSEAFGAGGDPDAVLAAVLDLLAEPTTVLVIEDLHWADDATLDLVRLIGRRIESLPAVVVLTYREDELGPEHPLRRVLGAFSGDHVRRLTLDPLSVEAVALLAEGGERTPQEIFAATAGNPFFVTELLASPDDHLSPTIRDAVLSRLVTLSPPARDLVDLVSVVPSRAERTLIERAPGDGAALTEAERAGIVGVDAHNAWFRHELARRAVEDALPRSRYLELHRLVLDALAQQPDCDPSRLVHHARHAGETDRMLQYASRAADDAMRMRAYRQTLDFLDLLLDHVDAASDGPGPLSHDELVAALVRRSYVLYALNRLEESATWGRRAVEVSGAEHLLTADALMILARAAYWTEGPQAASALVLKSLEMLGQGGTDEQRSAAYADLARSYSNLVNVGPVAEPDPRVIDAAERAIALAVPLGRTDLESHALQYLGNGRLSLGDPRGAEDLERAVVLAEVDPRDELPVRACVNASGSLYRAGRLDEAERFVELGLRRSRGGDFFAGDYRLELTRAGIWMSTGRWDEAGALLESLVDRLGEPGIMRPLAASLLARLRARQGSHTAAQVVLDSAVEATEGSTEPFVAGPLAVAVLEVAWLHAPVDATPPLVDTALELCRRAGCRSIESELVGRLRRAELPADPVLEPVGPWRAALAGDHRTSAAEWSRCGERYERAVEARDLDELRSLGATATVDALSR